MKRFDGVMSIIGLVVMYGLVAMCCMSLVAMSPMTVDTFPDVNVRRVGLMITAAVCVAGIAIVHTLRRRP